MGRDEFFKSLSKITDHLELRDKLRMAASLTHGTGYIVVNLEALRKVISDDEISQNVADSHETREAQGVTGHPAPM